MKYLRSNALGYKDNRDQKIMSLWLKLNSFKIKLISNLFSFQWKKNILLNYSVLYHYSLLHRELHNERAIKYSSCYNVKSAVHYSTCVIKF